MALWSGRFTEGADAFTQRFGASLPVDQRLYVEDIAGSIAHANMLAAQGIIATADAEAIAEGLQGILADITTGALTLDVMESEPPVASAAMRNRGIPMPTGRVVRVV